MTERHLDGNGVAGLLSELMLVDATSINRTCQMCGGQYAIAAHRAYHGAGVVLRCPSCDDVALRIGVHDEHLTFEWRGTFAIDVPRAPSS